MNSLVTPPPRTAPALCLPDGRIDPECIGWSSAPLADYRIPGSFGRRKRWNHWCITTPNWMLAITLIDMDLLSFGAAYFLDLHSGKSCAFRRWRPLSWRCELPDSAQADHHFEHPLLQVQVSEQPGRSRLSVQAPNIGGQALHAELDIQRPAHMDSMNLNVPLEGGGFHASSRQPGLPVSGSLQLGKLRYQCIPGRSFATFELGRGVWPHRSHWQRAAFAAPGGVAGNFGSGWSEHVGLSDNALWFGGVLSKLGSTVHFAPVSAEQLSPWRIYSDCGRVDLQFQPRQLHRTYPRLGLFYHDNRQWFGEFNGTLRTEEAEAIPLHSAQGWIGLNDARW